MSFLYSQFLVSLPRPTTSCAGKTVIVTGSNVGLGKEAARHFVRLGASSVILAVRSIEKGEAAKKDIEASTKCAKGVLQVWKLDMLSYDSVLSFAERANKELSRLDIAILNAGTASAKWTIAEQDESNITVNVVSTFLLAFALLPKLKATAKQFSTRPNLTIVSSEVHAWAKFPEKDTPPNESIFARLSQKPDTGNPDMGERYQATKLLEVLIVRAMAEEKSAAYIPITINYVNPGLCHSELSRDLGFGFEVFKFFVARSTEAGSRNLVYAGLQGPESHGHYVSDCQVHLPSKWVMSTQGWEVQRRVWKEIVEKLEKIKTGVTRSLSDE
ncbi:putative short-chain dehydrogenase [Westerdykella ornata]|uniref:Putative short-chain dehydrogenase n=1 Tax=Westerdykella ornata TaxID=318751 RepID=A0A6A6JR53_WESOR|nr:putative short-chain dehydrogenase [Westerdykella ornata]KAF2278186.1 putative short-chain dehydrogenase [Westerdykella ornata]